MKTNKTLRNLLLACHKLSCGGIAFGALAFGTLVSFQSTASASELKHKVSENMAGIAIAEMSNDKATALQTMQPRKADNTPAHPAKRRLSGKEWDTLLKPYIDAHRSPWMRS